MKRAKTYIIALIALFLVVLLLGRYVKGLDILSRFSSAGGKAAKAVEKPVAAAPAAKSQDKTSQPEKPTATATTVVLPLRNIEGLLLHLSQPLLFEVSGVRGLAAAPQFYYIATSGSSPQQAMLYRVRRDTNQMESSRNLAIGSMSTLGGIHLGQGLLWVPLSQGAPSPATLILGLDPATLETRHTMAVDGQITAVAQGLDGMIYGIEAESGAFHVWNLDGKQLQRVESSTGLRYTDLEIARSRVLAVSVTEVDTGGNKEMCGVIDVLDPVTFKRIASHVSHARSMHDNQVTRAGFALMGDELFFLPDDGKMAMLLTYRPVSGNLDEFLSPQDD